VVEDGREHSGEAAEQRFEPVVVATVRSPWPAAADVPVQGGPAAIDVLPPYAEALDGVERGTHLWVVSWLDRAGRSVLVSRPRKLAPRAPSCGVFASRSPARPNPIAINAVRLVRRDGLRLEVDALDLADGTPVLDIKSYVPGGDAVFAARREPRVPPALLRDDILLAILRRDLENHVGERADAPASRLAVAAVFRAIRAFACGPRDPAFRVRTNRADGALDALIGLLGADFAGGRIELRPDDGPSRFEFRRAGDSLVLLAGDPRLVLDGPEGRRGERVE
jgi:tRNA-Thr(GGU) m(6)t(6)A37 methyltransferase TsaA